MGDRATCPVCGDYGSNVYYGFHEAGYCPRCKTSYKTVQILQDIELKKQQYKKQKVEKEIIEEITSLKKELVLARESERQAVEKLDSIKYKFEELCEDLEIALK